MNIKKCILEKVHQIHRQITNIINKQYATRVGYCLGAVLLIWLVMYPEYSLTSEACRIVDENGQEIPWECSEHDMAVAVLEADADEIVFKSKIWEMITEWGDDDDRR